MLLLDHCDLQNVSILDYIGVKDDGGGGDNWSYNTCNAAVKSSPPTNQHPALYRPDALNVTHSSNSVKALPQYLQTVFIV